MKKILLCTATILCLSGFAQSSFLLTNNASSATITPNSTITAITTASNLTTITIDIKNISNSTQSYNVIRYDLKLNAASSSTASAFYCFASYCYGDNVYLSPNPMTLNAGQSASQFTTAYNMLSADLQEANTVGYSAVKYTFFNTANANDSIQFTIRYNEALGLKEMNKNNLSFELYPNPASETTYLNITTVKATESALTIYNALGAAVIAQPVSLIQGKNKIELNVESLPSGVYFANVKTGNTTITKKFIVK